MNNNKKKAQFIHIPKTGGQSVFKALKRKNPPHKSIYAQRALKGNPIFATVRNPYDRAVSLYHWYAQIPSSRAKRRPHNAAMGCLAAGCKDVNEFWCRFIGDERSFAFQAKHSPMLRSQMFFLSVKEECKKVSPRIDTILSFESLSSDWDEMVQNYGLRLGKLPHINSSKHKHWSEELNQESMELIKKLYACDFEHFNY